MQKLMKVRCLTLVLCFFACSMQMVLAQLPLRNANNAGIGSSQGMEDEQEKANRTTWGRDTTKRRRRYPWDSSSGVWIAGWER